MNELQNEYDRKRFLKDSFGLTIFTGLLGAGILSACNKTEDEPEVSPAEDLMQEHGLLNRILLIYDSCSIKMLNKESFRRSAITDAADIIRKFVEDYHEKQEEEFLFPRFIKANQQTELVKVLQQQHNAGRAITDQMLQLGKLSNASEAENEKLNKLLHDFVYMYRPHEAREDTVLFPAFRKIVSKNEYDSLGEQFEKNEHKLFGEDGFETMEAKVAAIEKELGIYELSQFTP